MAVTLAGALELRFQVRGDKGVHDATLEQFITNSTTKKNEPFALLFVPGAFTPTCQGQLCELVQKLQGQAEKADKIARVIVVTPNDCDVNHEWQQAAGQKKIFIAVLNDMDLRLTRYCQNFFPQNVQNTYTPPRERGLGSSARPCRAAIIFDEKLRVVGDGPMYKLKDEADGKLVIDNGTTSGTKPSDIIKKLQALQRPVEVAQAQVAQAQVAQAQVAADTKGTGSRGNFP